MSMVWPEKLAAQMALEVDAEQILCLAEHPVVSHFHADWQYSLAQAGSLS